VTDRRRPIGPRWPRLDARSLLIGGLTALVIAVPAGVVAQLRSGDDETSNWTLALFMVVLIGFVVGGMVAARRQAHAPLAHGAAAALGAFVLVQTIGIIRRSISGDDLSAVGIAFTALLSSTAGTVGGMIANWRRNRESVGTTPARQA